MIFWALGASIGFPALYIAALTGIKPGEEGLASGVITTSQRVGFPLGLAVLVTVTSIVNSQPMGTGGTEKPQLLWVFAAFIASTIMSVVGFALISLIRNEKTATKQTQLP